MLYMVLFAALVAVMGLFPPIPLPFSPVPITLQTLGIMLAGSLLGGRKGFLSMILFAFIALYLPLLAGGRTGMGSIVSPTGGFFLSWPVAAAVIGWLSLGWWKKAGKGFVQLLVANLVGGILVIYLIGVPYMAMMADLSLQQAMVGMLAFIPGDILKVIIASYLAYQLNRVNPRLIQQMQGK